VLFVRDPKENELLLTNQQKPRLHAAEKGARAASTKEAHKPYLILALSTHQRT